MAKTLRQLMQQSVYITDEEVERYEKQEKKRSGVPSMRESVKCAKKKTRGL